jgi:hypothetical protein
VVGWYNSILTPDKKQQQPTGGIEPPTFRLQSECSTTKLSRHATGISARPFSLVKKTAWPGN